MGTPHALVVEIAGCVAAASIRHDGYGGRAGKAELLTSIEGVSNRPVRKIVLLG